MMSVSIPSSPMRIVKWETPHRPTLVDHSSTSLLQIGLGSIPPLPISVTDLLAQGLDSFVQCLKKLEGNLQIFWKVDTLRKKFASVLRQVFLTLWLIPQWSLIKVVIQIRFDSNTETEIYICEEWKASNIISWIVSAQKDINVLSANFGKVLSVSINLSIQKHGRRNSLHQVSISLSNGLDQRVKCKKILAQWSSISNFFVTQFEKWCCSADQNTTLLLRVRSS